MTEILLITVPSAITSIVAWFLARGKYQTEVQGSELDNVEKAIEIWRRMAEELKNEVVMLRREASELRQKVESLETELKKHR
jgi:predicted RNase H-like nuclease (RuvC/YqgF family)